MGIFEAIKSIYFSLEDRYYALLDAINEKIPVYKIVDPIDRVFPSFLLLIIIVLAVLVYLFTGFKPTGFPYSATIQVFADDGITPLEGAKIVLLYDSTADSLASDKDGKVSFQLFGDKNVSYKVSVNGYVTQEGNHLFKGSEIFTLKMTSIAVLKPGPKTLVIRDSSGNPILGQTISIAISCQNGQTIERATLQSEFTIELAEECKNPAATVRVQGYQEQTLSLASERTVFSLSPLSEQFQENGFADASVSDSGTGKALEGITLKLYSKENVLISQGLSDSSGSYEFEAAPGNYFVKTFDEKGEYASKSSELFLIQPQQTVEIILEIDFVSTQQRYKLKLQAIDAESKQALQGASVLVFSEGLEIAALTTDALGKAETPADSNKTYSASVSHADYLVEAVQDLEPVDERTGASTKIELEKIVLEPANSGRIVANIFDEQLQPVSGARVFLYKQGLQEMYLLKTVSGADGTALFEGLPSGSYYAKAETASGSGESDVNAVVLGSAINLKVLLFLSSGAFEAYFRASPTQALQGVSAKIYNHPNNAQLKSAVSDKDGKIGAFDFKINVFPYLEAQKEGYYFYRSAPVPIIINTTSQLYADIPALGSIEDLKLEFVGVYAKYSDKSDKPAAMLSANNNYIFRFRILVPAGSTESGVVAHVRAGLDSDLNAGNSAIVIEEAFAAKATAIKSSVYNPQDAFANTEITSGQAKQANIEFGNLGAGVYDFYVKAFIRKGTLQYAPIEIHYALKSSTREPTEYFKRYLLSTSICTPGKNCPNFQYYLTLSEPSKQLLPQPIAIDSSQPDQKTIQLYQNVDYRLDYMVFNTGAQSYSNIAVTFSDSKNALQFNPSTKTIPLLQQDTSFSDWTALKAVQEANPTSVTINLSPMVADHNYSFKAKAYLANQMDLKISPTYLHPNVKNLVVLQASDATSLKAIEGVLVKIKKGSQDFSLPDYMGTTDANGYYVQELPASALGTIFYFSAEKPGYMPAQQPLEVKEVSITEPTGFECVKVYVSKASASLEMNLPKGGLGVFYIDSTACDKALWFYVHSELTINPKSPTTAPGATEVVQESVQAVEAASNTARQGTYSVYIDARIKSSGPFTPISELTVNVFDPDSCFSLEKTTYDLLNGRDSGTITKKIERAECSSTASDDLHPSLSLDSQNAAVESKAGYNEGYATHSEQFNAEPVIDVRDFPVSSDNSFVLVQKIDFFLDDNCSSGGDQHAIEVETASGVWENITSQYAASTNVSDDGFRWVDTKPDSSIGQAVQNICNGTEPCEAYAVGKEIKTIRLKIKHSSDCKDASIGNFAADNQWKEFKRCQSSTNCSYGLKDQTNYIPSPLEPGWTYSKNINDAATLFGCYPTAQECLHYSRNFQTFVYVDYKKDIQIGFQGDDGHGIYVNEQFVGGIGHSTTSFNSAIISLQPNVWTKINATVHNGSGDGLLKFNTILSRNVKYLDSAGPDKASLQEKKTLGEEIFFADPDDWTRKLPCQEECCPIGDPDFYPKSCGLGQVCINYTCVAEGTQPGQQNTKLYKAEWVYWGKLPSGPNIEFDIVKKNPDFKGTESAVLTVEDYVGSNQISAEEFHIKLTSGQAGMCYGYGKAGFTGQEALPNRNLSWKWGSVAINSCDYGNSSGAAYCDSVQFGIELAKKMDRINEILSSGDLGELPAYLQFNSYLIADGYSEDFQKDFSSYFGSAFSGADSWFYQQPGAISQIFSNPQRLSFGSRGTDNRQFVVQNGPGLYAVELELTYDSEVQAFFVAGEPNVKVKVNFSKIEAPAKQNVFYLLPFDGEVGLSAGRDGYGLAYVGEQIPIVATLDESVSTKPASSSNNPQIVVEKDDSFASTNKTSRGSVLKANSSGIVFMPSDATPVLMRIKAKSGSAYAYYYLVEGSSRTDQGSYASLWDAVASTIYLNNACRDFAKQGLFYGRQDSKAGSSVCSTSSYGFYYNVASSSDTNSMYARTIFYTPKGKTYYFQPACPSDSFWYVPSFAGPTGSLSLDYSATSMQDPGTGKYGLELDSVKKIFDLTRSKQLCVVYDDTGNAEFYWNEDNLKKELKKFYPTAGSDDVTDLIENVCSK